jgi:hypothetical protein
MTVNKMTIMARVPTVQYGYVEPAIELGENSDESIDEALKLIKKVSDMTAGDGYAMEVRGLPVSAGRTTLVVDEPFEYTSQLLGKTRLVKERKGHKYIEGYMGGSSFPSKFYAPFDRDMIIKNMLAKFPDAKANEILAMWKMNNEMSTGYGTAIHAAMENFDRNRDLGEYIRSSEETPNGTVYGPNKALSKNPFLKKIVEDFHEGREKEDVLVEEFIWDDRLQLCGSVDRIKIVDRDKKILRIQDYKTDGDIHEKLYQIKGSPFKKEKGVDNPDAVENELLGQHWIQLSVYGTIAKSAGWTVEGLDVFWLNPNKLCTGKNPWETFSRDMLDITKGLK